MDDSNQPSDVPIPKIELSTTIQFDNNDNGDFNVKTDNNYDDDDDNSMNDNDKSSSIVPTMIQAPSEDAASSNVSAAGDDENDNNDDTTKKSKKDKKDKKSKKDKKDKKDSKKEKKDKKDRRSGTVGRADTSDGGFDDNDGDGIGLDDYDESLGVGKRNRSLIKVENDDPDLQNGLDDDLDDGFVYDEAPKRGRKAAADKKEKKDKKDSKKESKGPKKRGRKHGSDGEDDDDDSYTVTEYDVNPNRHEVGVIDQNVDENLTQSAAFFRRQEISKAILKSVRSIDTKVDLESHDLLQSIDGLLYQMLLAATNDRDILTHNLEAAKNGTPLDNRLAIQRKMLFPIVMKELSKPKDLLIVFLEHGLLGIIRLWIMPDVNGNLPPLAMRKGLYDILLKLPVQPEHFESGTLGETILLLLQHPHELPENRMTLKKCIQKWSRIALRTTAAASSQHMLIANRSQMDLDTLRHQSQARAAALDEVNVYNIPSNAEFFQAKRPSMAMRDVTLLPRGLLDRNQIKVEQTRVKAETKQEKGKKGTKREMKSEKAQEEEDDDEY